jgi:hypothetical protein
MIHADAKAILDRKQELCDARHRSGYQVAEESPSRPIKMIRLGGISGGWQVPLKRSLHYSLSKVVPFIRSIGITGIFKSVTARKDDALLLFKQPSST